MYVSYVCIYIYIYIQSRDRLRHTIHTVTHKHIDIDIDIDMDIYSYLYVIYIHISMCACVCLTAIAGNRLPFGYTRASLPFACPLVTLCLQRRRGWWGWWKTLVTPPLINVSSHCDEVDDKHSPSPSQLDGRRERDGGREGGRESLLMCHTVFAEAQTLMTDIGYASSY